jgi:hypothetical protein
MLDTKLFEFAKVHVSGTERYIMAKEERTCENTLKYLEENNLRIENIIFNPRTNQIRFMFLPCTANSHTTEVFNVTPTTQFLRRLWELPVTTLQGALTQYMVQSDLKYQYDDLEDGERLWLTSVILGAKEE